MEEAESWLLYSQRNRVGFHRLAAHALTTARAKRRLVHMCVCVFAVEGPGVLGLSLLRKRQGKMPLH